MKRIMAVATVAVSAWSCSGRGPVAAIETAAPAPEVPALAELQPGTFTYLMASHRSVQRVLEGQPMADTIAVRFLATMEIDPDFAFQVQIDSLLSARPTPPDLDGLQGRRFAGRTTAAGGVNDLTGPADESPVVQAVLDVWRAFLPRLPDGGAAPGMSWSDSLDETRSQTGTDLQVTGVTRYRSGEWEPHDGQRALRIMWEREYAVSGTGEQFGQQFTISGDGLASGWLLISSAGGLLSKTAESEMRGQITIPTMGISFPIAQVQIDTALVRPR